MAQNKDLVADAQTLLEENLSEKESVESARRLVPSGFLTLYLVAKMLKICKKLHANYMILEICEKI